MARKFHHMCALVGFGLLMLACVDAVNARLHKWESNNAISSCSSGKYYDLKLKECRKCSSCPMNEIIRRPCHKHRDTVCGPFTEFDRFHQAPSEAGQKHGESPSQNSITNNEVHRKMHAEDQPKNDKYGKQKADAVYETVPTEEKGSERNPPPGLASVTTDADEQWRLLALVLIGVLSVVSLLLVVFVFIACYMLKRRRLLQKTIVCSSDAQPTGHYFRPPVFTGDRINPTDHMRALLHAETESHNSPQQFRVYNETTSCLSTVPDYADDVADIQQDGANSSATTSAESVNGDQSSGYSSAPGLPEVIPGPSTDYVYFKAPVKHSFS